MIDGYFSYTPAFNPVFTPLVQPYEVTNGQLAAPVGRHVEPLTHPDAPAERVDRQRQHWQPPAVENDDERYPQCVVVGALLDRYDTDG